MAEAAIDAILFFTALEVALDAPDCVGAGLAGVWG